MRWTRTALAVLLVLPAGAFAQRSAVLVDAAHGGSDAGARLNANLLEKEVTLAFAGKVVAALKAKGLETAETRTGDTTVTIAQRTAAAQQAKLCVLLHATASGTGVHIFTALSPAPDQTGTVLMPWGFVQHGVVGHSQEFARSLQHALQSAGVPVLLEESADSVLDGMSCAAVSVELAPVTLASHAMAPADAGYQQRVAAAIADAAAAWRGKASQ